MTIQPTDTIDLQQLIHSNNAGLFPDQRKGWVIISFPFIQLHFVCKFLEVRFAKPLETGLCTLPAHCFWDDVRQTVHMVGCYVIFMQQSQECSERLICLNSKNLVFHGKADSKSFNISMAQTWEESGCSHCRRNGSKGLKWDGDPHQRVGPSGPFCCWDHSVGSWWLHKEPTPDAPQIFLPWQQQQTQLRTWLWDS